MRSIPSSRFSTTPKGRKLLASNLRGQRRAIRNRILVETYLLMHHCVDCGESDPVLLELDHVTGDKAGTVSDLITRGSTAMICRELRKCQVRCCNCHRRRHQIVRFTNPELSGYQVASSEAIMTRYLAREARKCDPGTPVES
jgi:hypothetical protein